METNKKTSRRKFLHNTSAGLLTSASLTNPATPAVAGRRSVLDGHREVLFESVEKIHTDGRWNGRPAIVFWKDHYYIFFRTGSGHGGFDGYAMMLKSRPHEPRGWVASRVLDTRKNEAETHVIATKDRIFLYVVVEPPGNEANLETLVTYTDDSQNWSTPVRAHELSFSFWKPATLNDVHYMAADVMIGDRRVDLMTSRDGLEWTKISTIIRGRYTETALVFLKDDTLLAVTRQGKVSRARPPYRKWTNYDGVSFGGPATGLVGNTLLVSGRVGAEPYPDDQPRPNGARTGLFTFDDADMSYQWKTNMVTQWGSDVGYPHILPLDDQRALIAWYDGEPYEENMAKQADLFLATVRVV